MKTVRISTSRIYLIVTTCVIAMGLLLVSPARAGWWDDIRLTYDPSISLISPSNAKCVASDTSGNIHVVWTDYRGGNAAVYYKMFDGSSWSADQPLSDSAEIATNPAIATDGLGRVHVVWVDYRYGNADVFYKVFDGFAWSVDWRLTDDLSNSLYPSVASGPMGDVHVVWQDLRDYDWEIYYKYSDGGSWGPDTRLTSQNGLSEYPSVAVDIAGDVHVAWQDFRDGDYEIYYKTYDGAWSADQRLTSVWGASERPCITPGGLGNVHLVWQDYRAGSYEIYYRRHDGSGWQPEELITSVSMGQVRPSVAADDSGKVHVVWYAYPEDYSDLYYTMYDGTSWGPELRLTHADYSSEYPSINTDPEGDLDVVWHDRRDGNLEIYWKHLTGEILPKPEIISIEPDSACWYSAVHISDVAGTDFLAPAKVWLQRSGEPSINAVNVNVVSSTQITCDINLGPAVSGLWDVVVQNPDAQMDTLVAGFRIIPLPPPEITSVEPDSGYWQSTVYISGLIGSNFADNSFVWLQKAGEPLLVAYDVTVVSASLITCYIDLETFETGLWDVVVQLPDGQSDTLEAAFKVLPLSPPVVSSITPCSWPRDHKVHITDLAGDSFSMEASVWFQHGGGSKIMAENVVVESAQKITCDIELAAAALGYWDVVVENYDTQKDTLVSGFYVDESLWGDEIRLTTYGGDSNTSKPNARCIAVDSSDNLHIVWFDDRSHSDDIYYKLYDGTWQAEQNIVTGSQESRFPAVAVGAGDVVHVVWEDTRDDADEIYYKKYDGAWSADEQLTDAWGPSVYPSIAARGDELHVVWQDDRTGQSEIFYKHYDGTSWGSDQQITSGAGETMIQPAVAADASGNVHVVWCEYDDGDLCYKHYDGVTWGPRVILSDGEFLGAASITTDPDGNIHVGWHGGGWEIYYAFSDGVTWTPRQRLTYDPHMSHNTSIAADADGNVYIMFVDSREGNNELYCIMYNGTSWEPERRLTRSAADTRHPSAALDSQGRLHVIYRDERFNDFEIFYRMRYPGDLAGVDHGLPAVSEMAGLSFTPNPVRMAGRITFSLPKAAHAELQAYDIAGRLVWSYEMGRLAPGIHSTAWDGTDQAGRRVAQGIYFVSLRAGDHQASAKVVVMR